MTMVKQRQNREYRKKHPGSKKEYFDKNPEKYKINRLKNKILYHRRRMKIFEQELIDVKTEILHEKRINN